MPRTGPKKEHEANVNFVLEIKKWPCLYNYTLEDYSKRAVVDAAWWQVSEAYGDTVENCKEKWKNVRTVFVRSMRKQGIGTGKKAPYYLNQVLQFLVPYVKTVNDETNSHVTLAGTEVKEHYKGETEEDEDGGTSEGGVAEQNGSQAAITTTNPRNASLARHNTQARVSGASVTKAKSAGTSKPTMKRKTNAEVDSFVEYFQEKRKKQDESDSHRKSFLLSLLPEVESMSAAQFRLFRRSVLDAIDDALGLS